MTSRVDILQTIARLRRPRTYLEIGVQDGQCFFQVPARRKIAVDPVFLFGRRARLKSVFRDPRNLWNAYYPMSSDAFFSSPPRRLGRSGLDLVFIDGLHTHEQSYRDFRNALRYLNDDGVIVLHDCNPSDAATAVPALSEAHAASLEVPGWTGAWCGDVWKTIVRLRAGSEALRVCVLDCDYGVGIVTRGQPEQPLDLSVETCQSLQYEDLERDRVGLLNLRPPSQLEGFLSERF